MTNKSLGAIFGGVSFALNVWAIIWFFEHPKSVEPWEISLGAVGFYVGARGLKKAST